MITNETSFRRELDKVNEFWLNGQFRELKERKLITRRPFERMMDEMDTRRVLIVTGPRRVGKTILLKQCIQSLCERVPWQNILYYSMDDPSLFPFSDSLLKDLIDYLIENIAGEGRKYIFLDEVHLYEGWYKWIKAYHDRYPDLKFVLSGSSSLSLQREANKYLRGRTIEFELRPLSFNEFLRLSGLSSPIREDLKIEEAFEIGHVEIARAEEQVKDAFKEFLTVGGFPEWFEVKNVNRWFERLVNDIPKKAIYEDLVELFGLRSPKVLEQILAFMLANQSRVLSYESINEVAKVDRATLVNYVEFLKASYLVVEILKFAKSVKEQLKSMKKYLAIDRGLRNALMKEHMLREENVGFVVENVIGMHLFELARRRGANVFYLRANGEIDFVYVEGEKTIPVEIKYRKMPKSKAISKFIKKLGAKKGVVITRDALKREDVDGAQLLFVPAWLFLLCQGL